MTYASFLAGAREGWGIVENDEIVDLSRTSPYPTLLAAIEAGLAGLDPRNPAAERLPLAEVALLPPIPRPGKIICIGVNYANRNEEYKDGQEAPKNPSVFIRFPESFVGHGAPLIRPPESERLDYEGEIVVVIGKASRRIARDQARAHIFGLTLMNEGTIRDWVRHAKFNVTQGKNFDRSGAIGPWIVPIDRVGPLDDLSILTRVNGELRQDGHSAQMMFPIEQLIAYLSTFTTLKPGDLIATGTPVGAGERFDPPVYLKPGDVIEVESPGIGLLRNGVADERP